MDHVISYEQFLTEAIHIVKRKYTESHPARTVSDYAPVREKVLSYIQEKGNVTESELKEFFKLTNEETGRKTNMEWVKANSKYFTVKEANGEKTFSLSKEGRRVHQKISSFK